MERRHFLASAVAASTLPLAGCTGVGIGTTDLRDPEVETEPHETHLTFRRDDRRLLVFSVRYRGRYGATGRVPLDLSVWHADDTLLQDFRVVVRAPAHGAQPITDVYLRSPWYDEGPDLDFHTGDDGASTVLAAEDLGSLGEGTLSLELVLEPLETPETFPVGVRGEFGFAETGVLGRSYRAEGRTTVEVTREQKG